MKDLDKKKKFVELRAKGRSFAKIAEEIDVSKPTLIEWSKDLAQEISNLRGIEMELLREQYMIGREARLKIFREQLDAVQKELAERKYDDISTVKLLELQSQLLEVLRNDENGLVFEETASGWTIDELTTTKTWSA